MSYLFAGMRAVTRFNDWLGRWASYLVLLMFVLLLLEVFLRYLFNAPTVWTNEFTQMLFGVYALLSGGHLMAHKGHVNVDILHSKLPPRWRAGVDIFTSVLFFIFLAALLYFGSSMAYESIERLETSQSAWNPPIWPVKAAIPIGTALLLLQGLAKLINDILILFDINGASRKPRQDQVAPTDEVEEA